MATVDLLFFKEVERVFQVLNFVADLVDMGVNISVAIDLLSETSVI
jgi:hypothetical protein